MLMNRANTMILGLMMLLTTVSAYAQPADIIDEVMIVPEVTTAGGAFRAEFAVLSIHDPVQLELIASAPIEASGSLLAASFNDGLLTIPDARMHGTSYWLEFEHNGNNRFTLLDFGSNPTADIPSPRPFTPFPEWQQLLGFAYDIGVGANGDVWVIGTDPQPGGYGIYHIDGFGGFAVEGGALRIDVDPLGRPWVVNFDHEIYRLDSNGYWQRMPGFALDIGIGADGSVWVANFEGIYHWNGLDWINYGGSGSRIDVGPDGQPWVVGFSDRIYTLEHGEWVQLPGEAGDIGVGADGSVWVIGVPSDDFFDFDGLQGIYRWNGYEWDQVAGDGLDISVGPDGQPWVTNAWGEIWRAL